MEWSVDVVLPELSLFLPFHTSEALASLSIPMIGTTHIDVKCKKGYFKVKGN